MNTRALFKKETAKPKTKIECSTTDHAYVNWECGSTNGRTVGPFIDLAKVHAGTKIHANQKAAVPEELFFRNLDR
jgi:hypothetical protein